jgi:NDP-sugar pyrophosphorylase family protein
MRAFIERLQAVAIVGGLGRRLRPHTNNNFPKAMLRVGTECRPMLEWVLKPWLKLGIRDFIFCTGYGSEVIEEHFGDGSRFGISITYSREDSPLETGGALKLAIERGIIRPRPFLIFFGDDFVRLDPREFVQTHIDNARKGLRATLIATKQFRAAYGILKVEGGRAVEFKEKPLIARHANVGICCFEPEVTELILRHEVPFKLERTVIPELVERGWLGIYEIEWEDWLPVNTEKEYEGILRVSLSDFYSKKGL